MDNQEFNNEVKSWGTNTVKELQREVSQLGIKHAEKSKSPRAAKDSITSTTGKKFDIVTSVRLKFPRHMVFVHKGVGRGHPISNPRQAKEWFNPVIEKKIEDLADIVAEHAADMVVSKSFEALKIR